MRAYEIGTQTGVDSLRLVERDTPEPGKGEVLVKVHAACLNYRDLLSLRGQYGPAKPEDRIMASDGVGSVAKLGEGVSEFTDGQRVIAPHFIAWTDGPFSPAYFAHDLGISRHGWLADYILLPASALIPVPDSMPDDVAATLPVAGNTSWHCIVTFGGLTKDSLVLAPGTGGVSIMTLQLAKAMGAKVAITSSSDEKLAKCSAMGADYVVNYKTHSDWATQLLEQTGGRGADIVVDTVGLASIEALIEATVHNGRIAMIGNLAGSFETMPNMHGILGKNLTLKGITSGSRAMLGEVVDLVKQENIQPMVDSKFAFEDAPDAFAHLDAGNHMGKVMITL